MRLRHGLATLLLACTAAAAIPAQAQIGTTHEVRRGDTLFAIARRTKHDGISRNQMILAIWRANQGAFPGGNINLLEVGTVLVIPAREAITATEPAEADRLVREMLARPAAALGREEAIRRYREGQALERKGDDEGALKAFLDAGEAGYGLAQRKLGQIYDKGNTAVERDYQASLRWYQKAREQGVEIDRPLPRMTTK